MKSYALYHMVPFSVTSNVMCPDVQSLSAICPSCRKPVATTQTALMLEWIQYESRCRNIFKK